ncbi:MAG: RNase P subunit p30 family protein [Candidatus Micrarchaeota archaeon]
MNYFDLNLQNPQLKEEELRLGFLDARTARIISLKENRDMNSVNSKELISVESANPELLRNCIRQRKPILCDPLPAANFYRDDGLIREAFDRETVFEIPISEFLKANFVYRAKLINQTRNFIRRCLKLDAKFIFTSRAKEIYELKAPKEMIAIASTIFDLTEAQAQYAISKRAQEVLDAVQ